MKKEYSKPDIIFESFSLSTSITAGCEVKPSNFTVDCGVKWSKGVYIFTEDVQGCTTKVLNGNLTLNFVDDENNGLCYHNPSDSFNVFNS